MARGNPRRHSGQNRVPRTAFRCRTSGRRGAVCAALSSLPCPVALLSPDAAAWPHAAWPPGTSVVPLPSLAHLAPTAEQHGCVPCLLPDPDPRMGESELTPLSGPGLVMFTSSSTGNPRSRDANCDRAAPRCRGESRSPRPEGRRRDHRWSHARPRAGLEHAAVVDAARRGRSVSCLQSTTGRRSRRSRCLSSCVGEPPRTSPTCSDDACERSGSRAASVLCYRARSAERYSMRF